MTTAEKRAAIWARILAEAEDGEWLWLVYYSWSERAPMASKRAQKRKACEGKHKYATMADALVALHQTPHTRQMSVYRCSFCGAPHIGHTPQRVKQAMRARRGF